MTTIKEHFVSESSGSSVWPLEIRVFRQDKRLEVDFDNGETFHYSAEYLRVHTPSAARQKIVSGCCDVGIINAERVGNYALRLFFDDGHKTGIYSFTYLYHLGIAHDQLWNEYLFHLKAQGLSRETPAR